MEYLISCLHKAQSAQEFRYYLEQDEVLDFMDDMERNQLFNKLESDYRHDRWEEIEEIIKDIYKNLE